MKPTQTAIATALAVAVVAYLFMFNGFSLFSQPQQATGTVQGSQTASVGNTDTNPAASTATNSTFTMPSNIPANVTELMMRDEVIGTGAIAAAGDSVTVNYVGALTDGKVFDTSANHAQTANGFTFPLGAGQVIKGWDQGVAGMKEGGKRLLLIPASLAYGSGGVQGVIPPNATLVFEVELLKVQKAGK